MTNSLNHGTDTVVLRKFGINETYQLAMYLLNQYRGTVLSCRYVIPTRLATESRTQLEEIFKVAVVDTLMRHPMMQVSIKDATSKTPSWIQLRSLDLTQHIRWHYIGEHDDFDETVQETIRVQLDEFFPDLSVKQPGWKFTIFRQGDTPTIEAILTWNHPHFDGAGAKVIHEDLVDMLNNMFDNAKNGVHTRTALDGNILQLPEAAPMLPVPLESLKSLPVDIKVLAKAFWEETRPRFLTRDPSLAHWCPIRTSPYKTQYRAFFIDHVSLRTVLGLCRKNKTTITGLMNGLALIAFSSNLDNKAAAAFQSSTIVDHRRNLPPAPPDAPWGQSDRTVGNYVTQVLHTFGKEVTARVRSKLPANASEGKDLSEELQSELWAVSAQNRSEIARKLEAGLQNDLVGLFKWVTDWQQTMSDMAKKIRQFTWLVTNIGVLQGNGSTRLENKSDGSQKWSISRAQFGLSAEIPAAAIEFAPVSVTGGGMVVSANWPDCAVDVSFGERIMADLERWLLQLGSQS